MPKTEVQIIGQVTPDFASLLTAEAIDFIVSLHRTFSVRRNQILERRRQIQTEIHSGRLPDFLPETRLIRDTDWRIAPVPKEIEDRRVEITGPVERKMIINALNSGAKVFMADFEDSHSPTWNNTIQGQINLYDAVRRQISYISPDGKKYQLNDQTAVLFVRPRGWHLPEKHVLIDGLAISGSLFDFGLFFFHNAQEMLNRGTSPYFYLPKLENHLEARLWNDVFVMAQDEMGIPQRTIKATVLIETILAAFETEEILYELRDHSAGLNCGRWDYIFSFIKKFSHRPDFVLPDRSQVTMTVPFMRSYSQHVIKGCHRRGAHAMGGMAAQIPIKSDPAANEIAINKVRSDKQREVNDGHDGTWVAHPGLVSVAMEVFNLGMPAANQICMTHETNITAQDLLAVPNGTITEDGLRTNINIGIQYLEAWLGGNGCVPLYSLMEDAATAEISRTQVWQWIHHGAMLDNGHKITAEMFNRLMHEELKKIGNKKHIIAAAELFEKLATAQGLEDFLTIPAYKLVD